MKELIFLFAIWNGFTFLLMGMDKGKAMRQERRISEETLLLSAFLMGGINALVAAKLACVAIWVGAGTSKLTRHFPFVVSTMMSNSPVMRPKAIKRAFFKNFPDDLRPGRPAQLVAHLSTAIEMGVGFVLLFSHGGWPTAIAAFVMVCFHLGILTSIPMGVPLEWNVFMIFGVLALFVGHADVRVTDMTNPLPLLLFPPAPLLLLPPLPRALSRRAAAFAKAARHSLLLLLLAGSHLSSPHFVRLRR